MLLKDVALIVRRTTCGKLHIFGTALSDGAELGIINDEEHLFIGSVGIQPLHIFSEYKHDAGNTPNELMSLKNDGAGLNYKNYKKKLK